MTAIRRFADWGAALPRDSTRFLYPQVCDAFADTLGCMLAGRDEPPAVKVRQTAAAWGPGKASVVGTELRLAAPWAALANGTAAHALDYDDYESAGETHPSAVLVPALLALAQERDLGGAALLDAYVVGFEVIARLGEAVSIAHYDLGWHATATLGAVGAAAAAARLLDLDSDAFASALGLSVSSAAGFNTQFGTMAKPLHAGLAAKSGILAACLAEAGVTASEEGLDGKWSLLTRQSSPLAPGFAAPLEKLGNVLALEEFGLYVKRYPSCGCGHRVLDAVLALRDSEGIGPADLDSLEVKMPAAYAQVLRFREPHNPDEARFCLAHCVAAALTDGALEPRHFTATALARAELRDLYPRVRLEAIDSAAPEDANAAGFPDDILTLACRDGRRWTRQVREPAGGPSRPLSAEARAVKFHGCTSAAMDRTASEELLASCRNLAALDDLNAF